MRMSTVNSMNSPTAAPLPAKPDTRIAETEKALVQLLRSRSTQEIRERMYDNPPGSPWWSACKTELEARNNEQTAAALVDMSRILDKMRISAERLDSLSDRVLQATAEATELLKVTSESGRRLEIAAYVMVGVTVVQLFYAAFLVLGRR